MPVENDTWYVLYSDMDTTNIWNKDGTALMVRCAICNASFMSRARTKGNKARKKLKGIETLTGTSVCIPMNEDLTGSRSYVWRIAERSTSDKVTYKVA